MSIDWISWPYSDTAEKYYFSLREWDGIDKPQFQRIFEITKEERSLRHGRFENFTGYVDYHNATFKFVEVPFNRINELFNWIFNNTKGKWGIGIEDSYNKVAYFNLYFAEETDATAFKLSWI